MTEIKIGSLWRARELGRWFSLLDRQEWSGERLTTTKIGDIIVLVDDSVLNAKENRQIKFVNLTEGQYFFVSHRWVTVSEQKPNWNHFFEKLSD